MCGLKWGEGTFPILDPQCRQEFLGALVPLWITFCHLFGLILVPLGSPLGSNLGAPGPRFCTLEPNLGTPGPVLGSTWGTLGLQSHQLRANLTSRTFNFEPTGSFNPPIRGKLGPSDSNFCKNSTPNHSKPLTPNPLLPILSLPAPPAQKSPPVAVDGPSFPNK